MAKLLETIKASEVEVKVDKAEVESKAVKKAEQRKARKAKKQGVLLEIAKILTDKQIEQLSEDAKKQVQAMLNPGQAPQVIQVKAGDTLVELFTKYPRMSFKKLLEKCEKQDLKIEGDKIVEK